MKLFTSCYIQRKVKDSVIFCVDFKITKITHGIENVSLTWLLWWGADTLKFCSNFFLIVFFCSFFLNENNFPSYCSEKYRETADNCYVLFDLLINNNTNNTIHCWQLSVAHVVVVCNLLKKLFFVNQSSVFVYLSLVYISMWSEVSIQKL